MSISPTIFHPETLPGGTATVLTALGKSGLLENAYLAGGTAVALQLGHRISRDLDFFTMERFDEEALGRELERQGLRVERTKWQTILGDFGDAHFSYFFYQYPLLCDAIGMDGIRLACLKDLAAMKMEAIAARGTRRDFVDLFMILRSEQMTLADLIALHTKKYSPQHDTLAHALRSLTYFADAEAAQDRPLEMLMPLDWDGVKEFFRREVRNASRELLGA